MKKQITILLIVVGMLIGTGGCESIKLDGFSIGAVYLKGYMTTTNTINTEFWKTTDTQTAHIDELMPTFSLNFKFK